MLTTQHGIQVGEIPLRRCVDCHAEAEARVTLAEAIPGPSGELRCIGASWPIGWGRISFSAPAGGYEDFDVCPVCWETRSRLGLTRPRPAEVARLAARLRDLRDGRHADRLWSWRAWSAERKRLCDAGYVWGESKGAALRNVYRTLGGPHRFEVKEVELDEIQRHGEPITRGDATDARPAKEATTRNDDPPDGTDPLSVAENAEKTQPPVSVDGVWLRRNGDSLEVLVDLEVEGWQLVIREPWPADGTGQISHIVEPAGIRRGLGERPGVRGFVLPDADGTVVYPSSEDVIYLAEPDEAADAAAPPLVPPAKPACTCPSLTIAEGSVWHHPGCAAGPPRPGSVAWNLEHKLPGDRNTP